MQIIEPLNTINNELDLVGGKGKSLTTLTRSGFKVPKGFLITTDAYKTFIRENNLEKTILNNVQPEIVGQGVNFDRASKRIRSYFLKSRIPHVISEEIKSAHSDQFEHSETFAVRSSANAEDLPDLSFAGQQETYLQVTSTESLLIAVVNCWASLWTPQAMTYRHQNGIPSETVAMAVVVQKMVNSDVSGILFTANPLTGDRSEHVINSSYGLGEAIVSGEITPDTFVVNNQTKMIEQTVIGAKQYEIVGQKFGGTQSKDNDRGKRADVSLNEQQIQELTEIGLEITTLYNGVPQDIEWAYEKNNLYVLQSRPITNLPVQPIHVDWSVPEPAKYVSRRQIVENMPDPLCPLFEELYLTKGLDSPYKNRSLMVGGGSMYITVNGYGYQRFDFPVIHEQARKKGLMPSEVEIDIAEREAQQTETSSTQKKSNKQTFSSPKDTPEAHAKDVDKFRNDLSSSDRNEFDLWWKTRDTSSRVRDLTMPESTNPTYVAFNNSEWNDHQLGGWFNGAEPRLREIEKKWRAVDIHKADDQTLLNGIQEMGIEEGYYWSSNSGHTFGVAKSTDDQLQCFLRETLPEHKFISGQFLSGFESKTMQANADLYKIAQFVRRNETLSFIVATTPSRFLMKELHVRDDTRELTDMIQQYLTDYGHQGYSLDFVEPTQREDPSALFTTLKAMVLDRNYEPKNQQLRAQKIRTEKYNEVEALLDGLPYWQFRFRLWLARKYNYIREEVAFLFGFTWAVLRPMAEELGRRLQNHGTLHNATDTYYLNTEELQRAIDAGNRGTCLPKLGVAAAQRRELREARKKLHPPGTLPEEASQIDGIAFKETQIKNESTSSIMRGFAVSSGRVTAKASVITGPTEFDKMIPGSILVSPLTTPAWTQLFAHASGLVTDVGSILAHGSIVAREYGIPAVLGVGNGTVRIQHGQTLTIDGDAGIVELHESDA